MRRTLLAAALALVTAISCAAPDGDDASDRRRRLRREGGPRAQTPTPPLGTPSVDPTPSEDPVPGGLHLTFAVIGDFGSGLEPQFEVARRMCRWRRRHPFDLVVTTGDNIYESGHPSEFRPRFFRPYRCLLRRGVRFRAALGNHDVVTDNGRPEIREPAFGIKKRNYVVEKRGVRFIIADSNSLNVHWLGNRLRARTEMRWKVVVFHHPVYSSGEHGSTPDFRPGLPRLFRRTGVDLVLNGHDHNYEATRSLRGIRYVVTGGGGASLRECDPRWFTARCRSTYHFLYVDAGPRRIVVRAVGRRGRPFHVFATTGRS